MAYAITKPHNGLDLTYWKITQRNQCSSSRVDWVIELSGYTSKTDRDAGQNPFASRQIVFTAGDHPVTEAETKALMTDPPEDEDKRDKYKLYIHITRIAATANDKAEEERTESEAGCLFFYGAEET